MVRPFTTLLGTLLLACPSEAQHPAPMPQCAALPALAHVPPAEDAPLEEQLTSFDYHLARLAWNDHRWQVMAGEQVIKDCGRREAEARQALRLIQDLGLTQRGAVGAPAPVMEYWLASGRAPTGITPGLRLLPVDLPTLRVEQIQAQWCLRDDLRVLYNFGLRSAEARRALAVFHKYGFRHIGVIGQAAPSMTVLLGDPDDCLAGSPLSPSRTHRTSARQGAPRAPEKMMGSVVTAALPPVQGGDTSLHRAHPASPKGPPQSAHAAGRPGTPAPSLPGWDEKGEWVPFDWRQVQLREDSGTWKLSAGMLVLASFGADADAARLALAAVRHYQLTELCRVGNPEPLFCYFLANGQAPRGLMFGLSGVAFQPDKLSVQPLGRQWALCEGDKVVVILGEKGAEAHQLLEAVQRNKFDRLVRLGRAEGEGMSLLLRVH
jgi:hypothetical protein